MFLCAASPDAAGQTPDQPQSAATADAAKPPDPPARLGGFQISGVADGYFDLNFNHPSVTNNQLQNFELNWGTPELNLAKMTVDKSDQPVGFHVDAGFGEAMRLIHAGDPAALDHRALRYIEQMYVIAKPAHLHGAEIDFGQFVTSAGAEVIESNSNWNYSRSLLFSWATPYYHFGARLNVPLTKLWTVGVQVVNAWNTVWGNNDMKNAGITSALTTSKLTWSANWYTGPNHPGTTSGKRNLIDTTFLVTPSPKVNFYLNGDYGRDNFVTGAGYNAWYGVAGAAHVQATGRFAISPRVEFFNDRNGFSTGTAQLITEATVTGEYKYNDHLTGRLELRHDHSDRNFFDRGAELPDGTFLLAKSQTTATLGLLYVLGPYK
ncbi:MAG TPA: outer membrane beta-barrel protein [Bryobacteraceae bacterium]|nr:outer membrane beta-barrel protein [Bryobacteraceae bacterium]